MTHNSKTNQSIENILELTQTLELVEKDSKIQIKLPEMKTTMPEKYTMLEQWDIHRQNVKIYICTSHHNEYQLKMGDRSKYKQETYKTSRRKWGNNHCNCGLGKDSLDMKLKSVIHKRINSISKIKTSVL